MRYYDNYSVKQVSPEVKRVYINNNAFLNEEGYVPLAKYTPRYDVENQQVVLTLSADGKRTVTDSFKGAIIDLCNRDMGKVFKDHQNVTVTGDGKGQLFIRVKHSDEKVQKREDRVKKQSGALRVGELFAGIGLLSRQIKRGMLLAGLATQLCFANELDNVTASVHATNQEVWETKTHDAALVQDDLFNMDMSLIPQMDILVMGYPCVAYSPSQPNPNHKDINHPMAGTLFIRVLEAINRANPAVIILENSPYMQGSIAEQLMEDVLSKTGYETISTTLKGTDFGGFEPRERLAKIYYSKHLSKPDLEALNGQKNNPRSVAQLLEPIAADAKEWKAFDYLKKHGANKKNGHQFCVAAPSDTKLKTFGANYAKGQPDSSFIQHPNKDGLYRMFTPSEHCNVRGIDGALKNTIVGLAQGKHSMSKGSNTKAHYMLGNSVSPEPWEAFGRWTGEWLLSQRKATRPVKLATARKTQKASTPKAPAPQTDQLQLAI